MYTNKKVERLYQKLLRLKEGKSFRLFKIFRIKKENNIYRIKEEFRKGPKEIVYTDYKKEYAMDVLKLCAQRIDYRGRLHDKALLAASAKYR